MYAYCGEYPLSVQLRPSNIDGAAGAQELFERIVDKLRRAWPSTHIILRADSGFCRDDLLAWCEKTRGVDYVVGLANNARLTKALDQVGHRCETVSSRDPGYMRRQGKVWVEFDFAHP